MIGFGPSGLGFSAAEMLTRLALVSARPNFELQFNIAQNTALDRLDAKIADFSTSDFGKAKTALLSLKVTRLERNLDEARAFKSVVASNRLTVKDALDLLSELRDLADPATSTEFDAKRTEVLEALDKLRTTTTSRLGASDGLSSIKSDGAASIEAIVTNGFATAADITGAQDAIDALTGDLNSSLTILDLNQDAANSLIKSADRGIGNAKLKIDDITVAERKKKIDAIQELQAQTAIILTSISLSFEAAQFLTNFVAENTVLPREIDPGSVLNLFA